MNFDFSLEQDFDLHLLPGTTSSVALSAAFLCDIWQAETGSNLPS